MAPGINLQITDPKFAAALAMQYETNEKDLLPEDQMDSVSRRSNTTLKKDNSSL
jgi:hypothetical protein